MCFKFVCIACNQNLPYFCGPPFANALNDIPRLCRSNAHLQPTGFKCVDCERLDGVSRSLEKWAKFHPEQRAGPALGTGTKARSVRERVNPNDARSPYYTSWVALSALKRAMSVAGPSEKDVNVRIENERLLREEEEADDEIEETAYHRRHKCCFCMRNFTSLPTEVTPSTDAPLTKTKEQKRSASRTPTPRKN